MNLTTKGRYAVMAMVDLAMVAENAPVKLSSIAQRQEITLNYLEQLFSALRKAEIVTSVRGPGGGYTLSGEAEDIRIADIIAAVDEPIKMTRCQPIANEKGCMHNRSQCATHALWDGLGKQIHNYLHSITLADVCKKRLPLHPALALPQQEECAHA